MSHPFAFVKPTYVVVSGPPQTDYVFRMLLSALRMLWRLIPTVSAAFKIWDLTYLDTQPLTIKKVMKGFRLAFSSYLTLSDAKKPCSYWYLNCFGSGRHFCFNSRNHKSEFSLTELILYQNVNGDMPLTIEIIKRTCTVFLLPIQWNTGKYLVLLCPLPYAVAFQWK